MAKDALAIPASSVEMTGMNDSVVIDSDPQSFILAQGVMSVGRNLERQLGKLLYKRTTQPIKGIHLMRGTSGEAIGVWVESRTKLVFFTTFTDFKNIAIPFP
jgi:hypothetical protein